MPGGILFFLIIPIITLNENCRKNFTSNYKNYIDQTNRGVYDRSYLF
jgi:hypothetical protein